ncbi:MAG TPA: hypothetical protein VFI47_29955 [Acidimicrobiales bacterium]|nr:hypothetical protein [Acidimicrobiales bacterium]
MDDLFRRWKTLQLVEPIFNLTVRGAARADLDHARYDVKALALDAIDFVVARQASFDEGAATLNRLEAPAGPGAVDVPGRPGPRLGDDYPAGARHAPQRRAGIPVRVASTGRFGPGPVAVPAPADGRHRREHVDRGDRRVDRP